MRVKNTSEPGWKAVDAAMKDERVKVQSLISLLRGVYLRETSATTGYMLSLWFSLAQRAYEGGVLAVYP